MVDMGDLEKVFKSQVKEQGGGKMTETGTVQVTDMMGLYKRFKNYRAEKESLEEALTSPRRNFEHWARIYRERRLNLLTNVLIPRLQAMFPGA